jgi:hypothetical protein
MMTGLVVGAIFCRRWRAAAVMVVVMVVMVVMMARAVVGEGTKGALSAVAPREILARRRGATTDWRGRAPCVLVVAVAALVARAAEALRKVPARPSLFLPLHSFRFIEDKQSFSFVFLFVFNYKI